MKEGRPYQMRNELFLSQEWVVENKSGFSNIRSLCAVKIKNSLPEYDDTWHEASEYLKTVVTVILENLFKLSQALIEIENVGKNLFMI